MAKRTRGGLIHKSITISPECLARLERGAELWGRDLAGHIRYLLELATHLRRPPHVRADGSWDSSVPLTHIGEKYVDGLKYKDTEATDDNGNGEDSRAQSVEVEDA